MLLDPTWFLLGLGIGLIVIGFLALGSYDRGYAKARGEAFRAELHARHPVRLTNARRATAALRREAEGIAFGRLDAVATASSEAHRTGGWRP